jgi:hypothetical protein
VDRTQDLIVARLSGLTLVRDGFLGSILTAMGAWGLLVEHKPVALVFLLPGLYALSSFRRSVRVSGERLVARGRLGSREVPLRDLTQVALSTTGFPWVDTGAGRPFHLRMVREGRSDRNPTATEFVRRVRGLATEAGARLEPEPERPTSPAGAHPWFSG